MEKKKPIHFYGAFAAIFFLTIVSIPVSALSENDREAYSFRFEDCTVTDALREISKKSGVKIYADGNLKKELSRKSYVNRSLDSIISDLLRGENCALVWNYYDDGNLHSIDLYTFDENDLKRTAARPTSISGTDDSPIKVLRDINEVSDIRTGNQKRRILNSRNRSSTSISANGASNAGSSERINTNRNTAYGTPGRLNQERNDVSGRSTVPANMRESLINRYKTDDEKVIVPEPPEPEQGSGLERPPMPPGL